MVDQDPKDAGANAGTAASVRKLLLLEALVFFALVPAGLWTLREVGWTVPVIPLLVVLGIGTYLFLRRKAPREMKSWVDAPWPAREVARVTVQFVLVVLLLTGYVVWFEPKSFLDLPRREPWIWGMIVFTYPFLSVLPQELFYRGFFWHRYGSLFPSRTVRVAVSALAFGFAHVFYGNALTVVLSALGGLLFAWTFARTRSLSLVTAEHALYGVAVFTVGLGHYFFSTGVQVI